VTKDDFLRVIRAENIDPDAFGFDGPGNECYVVEHREGRWVFYYSERGLETGLQQFPSESAALEFLLQKLRSDPTVNRPGCSS